MNKYDVKRLALVLAVQAEIEGMKTENQYRQNNDHDPTYNQGHFQEKAEALRNLAYLHDHQL